MRFDGWIAEKGSIKILQVIEDLEKNPNIGAITTFDGIVRDISDNSDKRVVKLEVEAWKERGDGVMKDIATRVGEKYGLMGVRIVHLVGEILIGESIVLIAIASIHRKEAFAALEEIINEYKNNSPVWKKEIYDDGSSAWITTASK